MHNPASHRQAKTTPTMTTAPCHSIALVSSPSSPSHDSCSSVNWSSLSYRPALPRLLVLAGLVLSLLLGMAAVAHADDKTHELHIAVLVPDDDTRPFTRKRMRPAIDIAVEKVSDPGGLLQEVDVHVHYADSKCDIAWGIKGAIDLHYKGHADVFLGPVCDYTAAPVARQSVFWDTPVLTYAQAKDFRAEETLSKVTRVGNDFFQLGEFFNEMFKTNHWRNFTIIYDPAAWDKLIDRLAHIMAESVHATILQLTGYPSAYFKIDIKAVDYEKILLEEVGTRFAACRPTQQERYTPLYQRVEDIECLYFGRPRMKVRLIYHLFPPLGVYQHFSLAVTTSAGLSRDDERWVKP
ncbi:hypothetical protein RRG08_047535 [Elysia crispata]|uniref:Receptor ligand binding region domain-containing protein n=1 Tax=Elysia crispata TaxID=231223 RepID=A0AAE1D201_9GAST|nr:hypothetical protein RRG08_047535 [Elysia crispata]